MEVLKILDKPDTIDWEYDEEADVLYLSVGTPKPAVGVDIGEGVVVRYDEVNNEVVGLTVLGLRERVTKEKAISSLRLDLSLCLCYIYSMRKGVY